MDIREILLNKDHLLDYITGECNYKIETGYKDSEFPGSIFIDIGDKRLLVLNECSTESEIREQKNYFLISKGLSHCVFFFRGSVFFYRSYGERKFFAYSNLTKNNVSKIDKLKRIREDFDILFRSRDVSGDFYEAFKAKRDLVVRHIESDIDNARKYLIVQRIFDRIFFIYFLCHKGIIKLSGDQFVRGEAFFRILLDSGDFFKNLYTVFSHFNAYQKNNLKIGTYEILIPYLNGGLFRFDEEEARLNTSLTDEWRQIFDFLNSYHWIIEDDVQDIEEDEKVLTPEILGHVYERSVVEWEKKGFEKEVNEAVGITERESLGVYYTPENITDYICENTILPNLFEHLDKKYNNKNQLLESNDSKIMSQSLGILDKISILDPACGSGAFLIKAADTLFRLKSNLLNKLQIKTTHYQVKLDIIVNNIFGVDILVGASEIAKLRLWLWLVSSYSKEGEIRALPNIEYNVRIGNSLVGWQNEQIRPNLTNPLTLEVDHLFMGLIVNANDLERDEFERARDLLRNSIDDNGENYSKAYQILNRIYRRSHGPRVIFLKNIIEIIRSSIYRTVNPSFLEHINQRIKPGYHLKKKVIPPIKQKEFEDLEPFHWKVDFSGKSGFDIIVGNPPYVFGGNKGISSIEKIFFKERYQSGRNKINLFALFIERSINLLKDRGRMAFIIPNTFLRVTSYEETRKFVANQTKIEEIVNLHAGIFKGVTASTIILSLQKEGDLEQIRNNRVKISEEIKGSYISKPQARFSNNLHIFDLGLEDPDSFLTSEAGHCIKLGCLCKEMIFGVVITKNKSDVISTKNRGSKYKKFLEGKDIDRYRINYSGLYLLYDKSKLHRSRSPEIFEAEEKILVQRISGGKRPLIAAYDNQKYYNKESINNIILSDKRFYPKYIIALLNSDLINYYYSKKFTNESKLTVNVSKAYLSEIPIREISIDEQLPIIKLVDRMIDSYAKLKSYKQSIEILQIKGELEKTEKQINDRIFAIYNISHEKEQIVKGNLL